MAVDEVGVDAVAELGAREAAWVDAAGDLLTETGVDLGQSVLDECQSQKSTALMSEAVFTDRIGDVDTASQGDR